MDKLMSSMIQVEMLLVAFHPVNREMERFDFSSKNILSALNVDIVQDLTILKVSEICDCDE